MNNGNGEVSVWTKGHLKVAGEETDQCCLPDYRGLCPGEPVKIENDIHRDLVLGIPRKATVFPMVDEAGLTFILAASPNVEEQHSFFAQTSRLPAATGKGRTSQRIWLRGAIGEPSSITGEHEPLHRSEAVVRTSTSDQQELQWYSGAFG
jgi:hypothetical protein